ncbi:MAG: cupin domain-containing protein [Gammaproteobacteria bacterium]|nr:cupin domain-containing protein [Gammaproteobacteria bacterium]
MKHRMHWVLGKSIGIALYAILLISAPVVAEEAEVVRAVKMDPDKLAGINLPAEEPFIAPKDVLEGNHRPRGEILHYGEQLITEVYEDDPATFDMSEPTVYDEFVLVLSGKLILTGADGASQEYVAGDSLVVPKGFTGTWKMLGNYRELIVIERDAYEKAYGTGEE